MHIRARTLRDAYNAVDPVIPLPSSDPPHLPPIEELAPESVDETLRRLAQMLDYAAPGRFVLAFAKCNLPTQRRALVDRVKVLAEPLGVTLLEVELTDPVEKLLPILRDRLAGSYLSSSPSLDPTSAHEMQRMAATRESRGKAALFVYGLEHSLPSTDSNPPILAHLNLSREFFRRDVPCPLVIWLPDYALTMVARGAPDFWAWRSGVYEFPPEPETAERIARMAVYDEAGHVTSSLSAEAKRERLRLLARLLDDYRELGDGPRERGTQADILWKMGNVHYDLGEWAEARARYQEALELARVLDYAQAIAGLLHRLGILTQDTGDLAEARHLYGQSLGIKRELGDKRGIAESLHQLGLLAQDTGDLTEARHLYEQSLALERELDDKRGIASALHNLGLLAQATGDLAEARRLYEQSLALERELGNKQGLAQTLHNLAALAQDMGELAEARRLYDQSLLLERELGDKQGIAISLHQLGRLAEEEGNLAEATRLFEESLRMLTELGSPDAETARRSLERVKRSG